MAISGYRSSLANASDELDITTFFDVLSSLDWHILKHNVLLIGRDMNLHIGKDENNTFYSHNLSNRNDEMDK